MNIGIKCISYTKKVLATIYRSVCEHPFILGLVFFLLLLYRFLPAVFGFLVSASPIIICTALLLGILLSFGEPNIPEIEEKETSHDLSLPCMHVVSNDLVMEKDGSYFIESHVENGTKDAETAVKEEKVTKRVVHVSKSERGALWSTINEEEEKNAEAAIVSSLSLKADKKHVQIENIAANKEALDRKHLEKEELHEAEFIEDATKLSGHVLSANHGQNDSVGLMVEMSEPTVDSHFNSSLDNSWKLSSNHDTSDCDSDSDHAESSSPDGSVADIIPMPDEFHPLLDTEDPQPADDPGDDSHSMSGESAEDGESDEGSGEEEAENQEEDGEEEEETKEEEEDGAALAVKWTEDDEKNLRVLGTSELERNQRLENVIAKRIARKNLRIEAEKNLIDLDGNETVSIMDQLSRLQVQVPTISTARRNPFDLPYGSEESAGLPPIPGSAPSVLPPRWNPFDLSHFLVDENSGLTGMSESHQGFFTVPQRETLFRRHESFAHGASFTGEFRQEKRNIKLRPYFVTERTNLEVTSDTDFQREFSEKSDSKGSFVHECESVSSVADQDHCEPPKQHSHQESECELVSSSISNAKSVEREMSSVDEVGSVDPLSGQKGIDICKSHEINISASEDSGASMHEAAHDFTELQKQNRHHQDLCPPSLDVAETDVTEITYTRSSSSASSEICGANFSPKTEEGSADLQQPSADSSEDSSISTQSVSGETEVVNDSHVIEPVYDSSPSTIKKFHSNIASFEEELLHGGEGSFTSSSSLSSETLVETSEMGSPSLLLERDIYSQVGGFVSGTGIMGEMPASDIGEFWVAPPNLSSVEQNESRYTEVDEIREQDVIQFQFSGPIGQVLDQIQ